MTRPEATPRTDAPIPCCPLPPGVAPLPVPRANVREADEAARLARVAKALADPTRLRMLSLIAQAQRCCRGQDPDAATDGVCVCELQRHFGLAQSKVSYHLRVLREAGFVRETRRGKWSFYAVEPTAAEKLLVDLAALLEA